MNKKLSYLRETARQLPTWRGARTSTHSPSATLAMPMRMVDWSNPKPATNVRQACRPLSATLR